jgi:type IV pilus assembly protein PilA
MSRSRGFTLIELLIVIAIMLVLAGMAVPYLLRSRMAANEASAVGSVRAVNNAEALYATAYPSIGFTDLKNLGGAVPCSPAPATACLVDDTIANGPSKNGYIFTGAADNSVSPAVAFTVNGDTATFATTGARNFFSDQTFVIRYNTIAGPAGATDKPLQ